MFARVVVRIGELMARVPKAQGKRSDIQLTDSLVGKYDVIHEVGFTPKQVERFQTLAAVPDVCVRLVWVFGFARNQQEMISFQRLVATFHRG